MSGPVTAKLANTFELSGNGTTISYSTTGIDGKRSLKYKDRNFEKQFSGNEIRTERSELGELVTVTLRPGLEGQNLNATVFTPGIDLGNANSQPLTTLVILSQHLAVIHPGKHGPLQDYIATMLKGTASHIETVTGGARR
jgi:hypothetical protein